MGGWPLATLLLPDLGFHKWETKNSNFLLFQESCANKQGQEHTSEQRSCVGSLSSGPCRAALSTGLP